MHNSHTLPSLVAQVPHERDGCRLDQVLNELFPEHSRTYLQNQIKNNRIQLAGKLVSKNNHKVTQGQLIQIHRNEMIATNAPWSSNPSITLSIVYEDDHLIVVNKPSGLVTHPAPGHVNHTLANALLHHYPNLQQIPRAGIIHRLDKDTSGLLIIPKTMIAYTNLTTAMAGHKIERYYQAIVVGHLVTGGTIDLPIGRHPTKRQKQAVTLKGKSAVTHYRILERFHYHTLLAVQLETGRTHQIRVHLSHIGYPLLGDPLYGRPNNAHRAAALFQLNHQALHAYKLKLQHPITHQIYQWEAPIPSFMQQLLTQLRIS